MGKKIVCILGGSGFIGREAVRLLTEAGFAIRIPTKKRERVKNNLIINPMVDVIDTDITDQGALERVVSGCDIVINLVGILHESKKTTFEEVHVELVKKIIIACLNQKIKSLIHISALGVREKASSKYLQSKWAGEQELILDDIVKQNLQTTILRPSIVFGPGDSFINLFSNLVKHSPVIPVIKPNAKFQPIFVEDLAAIILQSITTPSPNGEILEVGGPKAYSFEGLIETITIAHNKKRIIFPLPNSISFLVARVAELLPHKILTTDNLLSLNTDNVTNFDCSKAFGLRLTTVEEFLSSDFASNRQARWTKRRSFANR